MVVSLNDPVDSLNPMEAASTASYELFPSIFEGLVGTAPDGKIVPATARSYDYDPAAKRIRFALDPGLKFSDGSALTSDDVAFSVKQWQSGASASTFETIDRVRTPDAQTVVFELRQPAAGLIGALTAAGAPVIPEDFGGRSDDAFWRKPIGSGPFALDSVKLKSEIVLTRNRFYRDEGTPHLDAVRYRIIPDANQRLLQFQAGKIDVVNRVAGDSLAQYPKGAIQSALTPVTSLVIANTKGAATKNQQLRQAISKAIDRKALVAGAFGSSAAVPTSVEPQIIPGVGPCPDCDYGTRDVGAAKALVAQSGYDGRPIELLVSSTGGLELTAVQAMQPMLEEAGVTVKVTPIEQSALLDRIVSGNYELAATNFNSFSPSPLDPLGFLEATQTLFSGASPAAVKKALADAAAASDVSDLRAATAAYEQALAREAALIPIAALRTNWAVGNNVQGFQPPTFLAYSAGRLSRGT